MRKKVPGHGIEPGYGGLRIAAALTPLSTGEISTLDISKTNQSNFINYKKDVFNKIWSSFIFSWLIIRMQYLKKFLGGGKNVWSRSISNQFRFSLDTFSIVDQAWPVVSARSILRCLRSIRNPARRLARLSFSLPFSPLSLDGRSEWLIFVVTASGSYSIAGERGTNSDLSILRNPQVIAMNSIKFNRRD